MSDHTFLYVEDDPLSREIMQVIMTMVMGITELTMFHNSEDFMARVYALPQKPDVILLDIHLTPHNGYELLRMLRTDPLYRMAKIIAVTASVMQGEVEKLQQSGFDGAIGKPVSMQQLPDLLTRILAGEAIWHVT